MEPWRQRRAMSWLAISRSQAEVLKRSGSAVRLAEGRVAGLEGIGGGEGAALGAAQEAASADGGAG